MTRWEIQSGREDAWAMNDFPMQRMRENARIQPMGESERLEAPGSLSFYHFRAWPSASACLYHGMRAMMRLGGMVASGGPYAIEHPAPHWVWVMPLSIVVGMACFFLNLFSSIG